MPSEATATYPVRSQDAALGNISEADAIFYRNLELQIDLMQRHLNDILNIAAMGVSFVKPESENEEQQEHREDIVKSLQQTMSEKKEASQNMTASAPAAAPAVSSEDEAARINLANVVRNCDLLMSNAVASHHNLDVIGEAVLTQAAALVFSSAASSASGKVK